MAFPENLLTDGEHIILRERPHPKRLIRPALALVIVVVLADYASTLVVGHPWSGTAQAAITIIAAVLALGFVAVPVLRWASTRFVITTDRILTRSGLATRRGEAIPLARIASVNWRSSLTDRAFGCGTLIIESASAEPLRFTDIPHVAQVHTLLYRQVNQRAPYEPPAWR